MPRRIEDEIRENRESTTRALAADRQPAQDVEQSLSTASLPVEVEAAIELYTRPINDTLIVGHPDAPQGWGRGSVGDRRGAWTQQTSTTAALTQNGREATAEALAGEDIVVDDVSVGDAVVRAFDIDESADTTRLRSSFRFDGTPATVDSVTLADNTARTVVSTSVSDVAADSQREIRVDISLTFTADTSDSAAVTDIATAADAIRRTADAQLHDVALGTDSSQPAQSDSGLGSEVVRKGSRRVTIGSRSRAQTIIPQGEPGTQPHDITELGVYSQAGDLVLRVVFGAETKDDRIRLRAAGGIDIR